MSQEAYANDGLVPSADPNSDSYAPQLTTWAGVPPVNWAKYLLGGTGHVTNTQATLSGGNENTRFTAGVNYRSEGTYLPGDKRYQRGGIFATVQHTSENKKFYFQYSGTLGLDQYKLVNPSSNVVYDILLPPNYPVRDSTGNYNWYAGSNPVAEINATAKTNTYNVISNVLMRYAVSKELNFSLSAGYNRINVDQVQQFPSASLYPGSLNYTNFGKNANQSFIAEPQLDYVHHSKSATLNLLAGATYQNSIAEGETVQASNFSTEALMQDLGSAGSYMLSNSYTQYKYASVFGRVTYNWLQKYIVNASVRQDASSKFGPGNRTGTFGAVGAAWLWGEEALIKEHLPFISFGKLRSSYGLTGNDQITDYQYLSTYTSSGYVYQDISGLKPARIANSEFHWEATRKLEFALELGFFKNRVLLNVNRYESRSKDQLVAYSIPSITGFSSYQANLPAVVKNTGWEFELNTMNLKSSHFSWSTNVNVTIPKNVLESFMNLTTSSYAHTLVIGEDISRVYGYQFAGLDNTGAALYRKVSGMPGNSPSSATDAYFTIGKRTPDFYGGIGNTFSLDNWTLDILGQFAKQKMVGNLTYLPGAQGFNNYVIALNRWTPAHQQTTIPKASTYNDFTYYLSSANYFDASYFRIKNITLNYSLPKAWARRMGMDHMRVYFQGQNIFTFWNRNNPLLDPESGTFNNTSVNMPPVKTFVIGIQTTF
jgi:TonB-linked SusC/RagA family outer membrane protein